MLLPKLEDFYIFSSIVEPELAFFEWRRSRNLKAAPNPAPAPPQKN